MNKNFKKAVMSGAVSALKVRLIADAIERDVANHVAELRRLADLAEGKQAAGVKVTKATKRKAKKVRVTKAKKLKAKAVKKRTPAKAARRGR